MNFVLPELGKQASCGPEPPIYSRVVTADHQIVTTSRKSQEMSAYVDRYQPMQLGAFWRLTDVDGRFPVVKQRGPYGDGLVLKGLVFKVDHCVANADGEVAHVVLVEYRTDTKYLLDDRFFDGWSYVRNVDLEKMMGPSREQFFM
jgi:hypothetical protein